MNKRIIGINLIVITTLFLVLEIASGYLLSSKRINNSSLLYALTAIGRKFKKPWGTSERLERVLSLREKGEKDTYPAYIYDPQVHNSGSDYWFGHPPNSLIIYCNEWKGILEFKTNKLGFRKTINENLQKPINTILVGDSYTEGACVNEPSDIASILGKKKNVLNLGRGGSGPLFQFGVVREALEYRKKGGLKLEDNFNVIWIIFTGNDLKNLVEERQTILSQYAKSNSFNTKYFEKLASGKIPAEMISFHQKILEAKKSNAGRHGYGETVIPGSVSERNALVDLSNIIGLFYKTVSSAGGNLYIVMLKNHPKFNNTITNNTEKIVTKECLNLPMICIDHDLGDKRNKEHLDGHLTDKEYISLGNKIQKMIELNASNR